MQLACHQLWGRDTSCNTWATAQRQITPCVKLWWPNFCCLSSESDSVHCGFSVWRHWRKKTTTRMTAMSARGEKSWKWRRIRRRTQTTWWCAATALLASVGFVYFLTDFRRMFLKRKFTAFLHDFWLQTCVPDSWSDFNTISIFHNLWIFYRWNNSSVMCENVL